MVRRYCLNPSYIPVFLLPNTKIKQTNSFFTRLRSFTDPFLKSVGTAYCDLVAVAAVYKKAIEAGVGVNVEL
jgi:ornithine cyclodeaminase/alanine dehydrogenase-like protein (mu-crystallin family)